jgi:hypothetical protein
MPSSSAATPWPSFEVCANDRAPFEHDRIGCRARKLSVDDGAHSPAGWRQQSEGPSST